MKVVYVLAAVQLVANLVGGNPTSAFTFQTRTLQHSFRPSFRHTERARSINSKPEEYDDGIGDIKNPKTNSEGEDLASEFYESLQKWRDTESDGCVYTGDISSLNKSAKDSTSDRRESKSPSEISPSFLGQKETNILFVIEEEKPVTPKIKFTGRPTDGSDYFGRSSGDTNNNVREEMMRKEFRLVSEATGRTAFTFQAGLALFMLIFFIYVGLTGGIVSGEDAMRMDFGGDDMVHYEQIIPLPRDSDNSVWV